MQFSIGPVQSFISASRKTRDLKAGSELLQSLAQEIARLAAAHGTLIFPSTSNEPAANIVLVELEQGKDPVAIAADVERSVRHKLKTIVTKVLDDARLKPLVADRDEALAQADALLEFYVAWAPLGEGYAAARAQLGAEMAARKALRNFVPSPEQGEGRPKSPLDPAVAGVVKLGAGWQVDADAQRRLLLKPREHLDGLGLVKRFWKEGAPQEDEMWSFPSTRTLAAMEALDLAKVDREQLSKDLEDLDCDAGDIALGQLPPADSLDNPEKERRLDHVRKEVRSVWADHRTANPEAFPLRPYYAILHGDGDGAGALLDELSKKGPEAHREFSRLLSKFTGKVASIVRERSGFAVYSGGDDVLALSPPGKALELADALRKEFETILGEWAEEQEMPKPTLTLGVAFVHTLDNLQDGVRFSQRLETAGKALVTGKQKKNALAVGASPRGGSERVFCAHWTEDPVRLIQSQVSLLSRGLVPRGFPYEVAAFAEEALAIERQNLLIQSELRELCSNEIARIAGRKRDQSGGVATIDLPQWTNSPAGVRRYADLLAVAHFLTRGAEE